MGHHSDNGDIGVIPYSYPVGKSRPLCSTRGVIIHRLTEDMTKFYIRIFTIPERCRLFGFPENYVDVLTSENTKVNVLGNSVVIPVIRHIVNSIPKI
jgi:site-specific DNA-cytosine methylase